MVKVVVLVIVPVVGSIIKTDFNIGTKFAFGGLHDGCVLFFAVDAYQDGQPKRRRGGAGGRVAVPHFVDEADPLQRSHRCRLSRRHGR